MIIKPTVGRVVWYRPGEAESALVHYDDQPCVAHIVAVHSDTGINVIGWDANGTFYFRSSVKLVQEGYPVDYEGQPHCEWMPYQVGQAKKHEGESNAPA